MIPFAQVELPSSTETGLQRAILTGSMQFSDSISKTVDDDSSSDSKLKVFLEGEVNFPQLELNGYKFSATGNVNGEPEALPLGVALSTDIYRVWNAIEYTSDGCSEFLNFHNCSAFTNTVGVESTGPFTLTEAHSSRPHSRQIQLNLKPNASTTVKLSFRPSRKFGEIFTAKDETSSITIDGSIVLVFCNGFRARVKVKLDVALPLITVSAPRIDFGVCRTDDENIRGFVLLSNPTNIRAVWAITHMVSTKDVAGITDDPTVFTLSPMSGELQGPTVSSDTASHAPPRDFNRR